MPKNNILKFILLFAGIVLFVDGLILILQKKIHLGTVLPFLIGLFFMVCAVFQKQIQSLLDKHTRLNKLWQIAWCLLISWMISVSIFFVYLNHKMNPPASDQAISAIIVLGSGITQGKVSPALAARLNSAAQLAHIQTHSKIIVSGGLDYGETITEAAAMSAYLQQQHHIDSTKILLEDRSTSTALNLKNSVAILHQQQLDQHSQISIVTSDFHTLRAAAIARKQGYTHFYMVAAPTPVSIRYNAWLREYFAYISGWVLGEY